MRRKRRLSMEILERRIVLDGAGLIDPPGAPEWESVIVTLNENVGDPAGVARGLVNAHAGRLGHVYEHALKGFSAQLPKAAVNALQKNPQIKLIEPDLQMQAFEQVVPTGVDRIEADLKLLGSSVTIDVDVAVIDTGIDGDHPDLDVRGGTHFYTSTTGPPKSRGSHEDGNYEDDNGHGSHAAGIVGAKDNDLGVVGVAPGARLWAVKVLNANGTGNLSDIIAGINWVTEHADTIEVANMSLGGQGVSEAYRTAIQRSVAAGVVYVVASGNEYREILGDDLTFGTPDDTIPAAYPEVAAIGAIADTDGMHGGDGPVTDYADIFGSYDDDTFADFSNFSNSDDTGESWYLDLDTNDNPNNPVTSPGLGIDLMMPGVDIYSTYKDGGYAVSSGTSMAAPHAAGLASLYIAANGRATDAAGVYAIRQALIDSGRPWRSEEGLGLITGSNPDSPDKHEENLGWAGASDPVDQFPTVTVTSPADAGTVSGTVAVTADASDDLGVSQVAFFVDGVSIGVDLVSSDGWSATWDTTKSGDGSHSVTATATDTANQSASDSVTVTVDNEDDAPTVSITYPTDASTVSGGINVTADASDDRGVSQVEFFVDGVSIGVGLESSDGWSTSWDTAGSVDGSHTITATATDDADQSASDNVVVTVNNAVTAMHVTDLDGMSNSVNRKKWAATVTITVQDASGSPTPNATVEGTWSSGTFSTASTNGEGLATVYSGNVDKSVTSVAFTINNIVHVSLSYDPEVNTDPDGDSNGTSIIVDQFGAMGTSTATVGKSLSAASEPVATQATPPPAQNATAVEPLFTEQHTAPAVTLMIDQPELRALVDEAIIDLDTDALDDELLEDLALAVL